MLLITVFEPIENVKSLSSFKEDIVSTDLVFKNKNGEAHADKHPETTHSKIPRSPATINIAAREVTSPHRIDRYSSTAHG